MGLQVSGRVCVDGGTVANNPVQVAVHEAQDIWPGRRVGLVVSLGCGRRTKHHDGSHSALGALPLLCIPRY